MERITKSLTQLTAPAPSPKCPFRSFFVINAPSRKSRQQAFFMKNPKARSSNCCPFSNKPPVPSLAGKGLSKVAGHKDAKPKYHHVRTPDLAERVLRDDVTFSSLIPRLRCPMRKDWDADTRWFIEQTKNYLIHSDGERHKCLRRAFDKDKMVHDLVRRRYLPWVEETVELLLERSSKAKGAVDICALTMELADRALCKVLGLNDPEPSLLCNIRNWSNIVVKQLGGKFEPGPQHEAFMKAHSFFRGVIERIVESQKTGKPFESRASDGFSSPNLEAVIGKLATNKKVATHHGFDDLATQCVLWMGGGSHNPAILACLTVGLLGEKHGQLEEFRRRFKFCDAKQRRTMLNHLTTEVLRAAGPAEVLIRVATKNVDLFEGSEEPVELFGRRLAVKKGDAVVVHLQEASWRLLGEGPEAKLFDPFRVPVKRKGSGGRAHFAFGYGKHRCMGGELGQAMAEVVVQKLFLAETGPMADSRLVDFKWRRTGTFKQVDACHVSCSPPASL